jgi:hypothetical protein
MFLDRTAAGRNSTFGFGFAETPEPLNTIMVGNSLIFLMVYKMALNSWHFTSYGYRKLNLSAGTKIWADSTFRHKSEIWHSFAVTSP